MDKCLKTLLVLTILIFVFTIKIEAQKYTLKGKVVDNSTNEALAFVNIRINESIEGVVTDIDGKFAIFSLAPVRKLSLSYIGYDNLVYSVQGDQKEITIRMQQVVYELSETLIVPKMNPANRIISEVVANRYVNDYEHLPSFTYTSYEKTIFRPESDSIPIIDSLSSDSSYIKARDFLEKQHFLIMENVVKRSFMFPSDNYNKVIASRVSGLSDPLFVMLMSQLQTTTFYKDVLKIMDHDYINPISKGFANKYYFEIQDTIIEPYPYDTTYIMSFRPLLKTKFDGLKGSVSISTNGYAIRNIIATPSREEGLFSVKIQQLYDFIDSTHWFPIQLNTDILFKNAFVSIDSSNNTRLRMMGRGKSYITDINLNPLLRRNQFGVIDVDVQPTAYTQSEDFWEKFRSDSLSMQDLNTYRVIDSLGKANNFDRFTKRFEALLNGKLNIGYIDLHLDNLINFNRYEGLRAGMKISTSKKLSSVFSIGGYTAYGFRDKKVKYGADGKVVFNRIRDFNLSVQFYDDMEEAGADARFELSRSLLSPETFRNLMVDRMDHTRCYESILSSRVLKYLTVSAGVASMYKKPLYDYSYIVGKSESIIVSVAGFRFTEASIGFRYAYGEKFMTNSRSMISLGTKYPIVQLSIAHGFKDFLDGQYEYNRFDFKINKSFFFRYLGASHITVLAGLLDREVPYVNLYNGRASYRPYDLYAPVSFATMRMDEFTSDRYASIFFSHSFGNLLFRSKHFNPEPEIITNIGFGKLGNTGNHQLAGIKDYSKGYYESGVVINKMLRLGMIDVGIGWFYRYGPYSFSTPSENMAWKFALKYIL